MSRWIVGGLAAIGLFLVPSGFAGADEDVKKLLDMAIKAAGGEEKLSKLNAVESKVKGSLEIMGMTVKITQETSFQAPDKLRQLTSIEVGEKTIQTTIVTDGEDVWIKADGKDVAVTDEIKAALRESGHMLAVMRLAPLKEKGYELSPLGEVKVENKPAIGIRVSKKDRKDVSLYFDKESHLVVRMDVRTVDLSSGQEVDEERIITEYGKADGMPVPKKAIIKRDGKTFAELEVSEYKMLEKLDDNLFKKP